MDVAFPEIASEALYLALLLSAPVLIAGAVIGLIVAALQNTTRLQDPALSHVPKMVGIALVLVLMGTGMGVELTGFTTEIWQSIAAIAR